MNHAVAPARRAPALTPDPAQRHAPFPLTDIQYAYWIGRDSTLELGNVSCHAYFEWQLGALDLARLEHAWNQVVARHDMLRAIVLPDGTQRILADVPHHPIAMADHVALSPDARAHRLAATREAMQQRVPDASQWPLFEIRATRMAADEIRLHIDLDLLTVDVQSFHIILGELERLYARPDTTLPPLSLSFRDYVLGRGAFGDAARHAADRDWWMARLPDLPAAPQLPLAVAPHSIARPDFIRRHDTVPAEAWRRFEAFAAKRNLTTSAALLACYAEVLGQWSRQDAFCLNLTHFHRERLHPEVDGMVGDFTSVVLVPRSAPQAGASFAERARRMQMETWQALSHRAFSGIEVIRELGRRDGGGRGTPMPVVFTSLLGLDIDALASPGGDGPPLLPEPEIVYTATPQVWFDHQAMVRQGALVFNWITIDALFPDGMVAEMFAAYRALLGRFCEDEAAWDSPVPALLPAAQRAVRDAANATDRDIPPRLLHDGFLRRAAADPDRAALIWRDESWTYDRLTRISAAMARRLHETGVAPGSRVVLSLPRGPSQIAAVLGTLRAGAAYVPVATDIPAERLRLILEDVGAAALVSSRSDVDWPVRIAPLADAIAGVAPDVGVDPDALAYILYTSGSTGRPKGVAIRHGAAWNTVADINDRTAMGADDRVLALSSLGFDLSVYDIFGPLAAGAAIVLCEDDRRLDPHHWLHLLRRHGVTVWNSVPALLDLLLDAANGAALPVRTALLSGDWIPLGQPARLRAVAPASRFIAMGGATEASIWSNLIDVDRVPPEWRSIPYGFPLANQSYRVLDREGRDRPDWVVGDLHIGGSGLAEGYWKDAVQTERAFITATDTGERLYRTGDLARYWPDGMLEFLGREDTQVKIAGHRIELSEVEAVLAEAPGVREAVAIVVERDAGARQIAAFMLDERDAPLAPPTDAGAVAAAGAAAETAASTPLLDRVRAFQAAADRVARIAVAHALGRLDAGAFRPDPRFAILLRQWRQLPEEPGDLVEACEALRAQPAWPGAEMLAGWIIACAEKLEPLLTGEQAPLELLFPGAGLEHADSLYRHNPAAEALGSIAAAMMAAADRPAPLRVLEVGGGVGSATAPVMPVLEAPGLRYHFTDVSLFFLDAARDRFGASGALSVGRFDINADPASQSLPCEAFDLIIASNVLHDAQDLPRTLGWLRGLLAPGGRLLLIEATRNTPVQMITGGFLEGFAAFADFRRDAGLPLLDATAWRAALHEAGFDLLHAAGDALAIGQHVILAQRHGGADPSALREHAAQRLPGYMLPAFLRVLDHLPLSANGKVDRKALAALVPRADAAVQEAGRAPQSLTERALAEIWSSLLATPIRSAEANFFRSGGDSLLAIRLVQRVRETLGAELPVRAVFETPVLADLAALLDAAPSAPAGADRPLLVLFPGSDGSPLIFADLQAAVGDAVEIRAFDIASRDPAPFLADPFATAEAMLRDALHAIPADRRILIGGWSSGAVLAAAVASRCDAAGLVLLDPVDWQRHEVFATRAEALAHQAPQWLRDVVAAQLAALAAFAPAPLACPALCLWADRREADWPRPEPAWRGILAGPRHDHRIAADHWSLLRDRESVAAIAEAIRGFISMHAMTSLPEAAQ
jgi:pyochelin synthetase